MKFKIFRCFLVFLCCGAILSRIPVRVAQRNLPGIRQAGRLDDNACVRGEIRHETLLSLIGRCLYSITNLLFGAVQFELWFLIKF